MKELNPQQQLFKEGYLNPDSPTFGNAQRSALNAGFSKEYAKTITAQGTSWFSEIIRDKKRLDKAEEALDEALELDIRESKDVNTNILEKKTKVAMFVAKGMGKDKYSERTEHTGKDGKDLQIQVVNYEADDTSQL